MHQVFYIVAGFAVAAGFLGFFCSFLRRTRWFWYAPNRHRAVSFESDTVSNV